MCLTEGYSRVCAPYLSGHGLQSLDNLVVDVNSFAAHMTKI